MTFALDRPFIVLPEEDRADESDDGVIVGEDANNVGAVLDLTAEARDGVCRVQLGAMLLGEGRRRAAQLRPALTACKRLKVGAL